MSKDVEIYEVQVDIEHSKKALNNAIKRFNDEREIIKQIVEVHYILREANHLDKSLRRLKFLCKEENE